MERTQNARRGRSSPSLAHPKLHLGTARGRKAPGIPRKWSHPYRKTFLTSSRPPFPWGIITHSHPDVLPKRLLIKEKHKHTQRETLLEAGSSGSACAKKPEDHAEPRPSCHRDCTHGAGGGRGGWKPSARGSSPTPYARRPSLGAGSPARQRCLSRRARAAAAARRWICASHPASSALPDTFLRSPTPGTPSCAPSRQERGAPTAGQ